MKLRLREVLDELGLTQEDFRRLIIAKKITPTLDSARISRYCNGDIKNVSLQTLDVMSRALGVPIDRLIEK